MARENKYLGSIIISTLLFLKLFWIRFEAKKILCILCQIADSEKSAFHEFLIALFYRFLRTQNWIRLNFRNKQVIVECMQAVPGAGWMEDILGALSDNQARTGSTLTSNATFFYKKILPFTRHLLFFSKVFLKKSS